MEEVSIETQTLNFPAQLATHSHPPPFSQKSDTCVQYCASIFGNLRLPRSTDSIFFSENRRQINWISKTFSSRHSVPWWWGGNERLRVSTRREVKCIIPRKMTTPWLVCAQDSDMRTVT